MSNQTTRRCGWTMAVALGAALGWPAAMALAAPTDIPNEFIVRLNPGFTIEPVLADYAAVLLKAGPSGLYLIRTPAISDDSETELELDLDPRLDTAEHNRAEVPPEGGGRSFLMRAAAPEEFADQPARAALGLATAQTVARGAYATVAVLDTGVAPVGPLAWRLRGDGFNFVDGNTDTNDAPGGVDTSGDGVFDGDVGHGTMVANLVAMVAPEAQILPIKVLDADGLGTSFDLAEGIHWAMNHHADVINLSLATPDNSAFVHEAVQAARDAGIVVVAAAGNAGTGAPYYPAAVSGALAVASLDAADHLAPASDFGAYIAVCAPGEGLVSVDAGGLYARGSGTSFAAPLVAGLAALVQSVLVDGSPSQIERLIADHAVNIDALNPGMAGLLGTGRIDAAATLAATAGLAGCRPEFNRDGTLNPDDLGDFITAYFDEATLLNVDYNADGVRNPDDLGDFITTYFAGCPGFMDVP